MNDIRLTARMLILTKEIDIKYVSFTSYRYEMLAFEKSVITDMYPLVFSSLGIALFRCNE